jgi:hypothetical protein
LLSACIHIKGCDEALAIVDAAVLLADTHVLSYLDSSLGTPALEAIKRAGTLLLEARLKIACCDEAFSEVDAAILLAFAHLSSQNSCNSATKCE